MFRIWIVCVHTPHGPANVAVQTNGQTAHEDEKCEAERKAKAAILRWNNNRWPETRLVAAAYLLNFEHGVAAMPQNCANILAVS